MFPQLHQAPPADGKEGSKHRNLAFSLTSAGQRPLKGVELQEGTCLR